MSQWCAIKFVKSAFSPSLCHLQINDSRVSKEEIIFFFQQLNDILQGSIFCRYYQLISQFLININVFIKYRSEDEYYIQIIMNALKSVFQFLLHTFFFYFCIFISVSRSIQRKFTNSWYFYNDISNVMPQCKRLLFLISCEKLRKIIS